MAPIPGPRAMRRTRRHTDPGHPGPVRSPSSLPPVDADKVMVTYRTRLITIRHSQNIILISPANNGWPEAHSGHKVQITPGSGQYVLSRRPDNFKSHFASKAKIGEAITSLDRPVLIIIDEILNYIGDGLDG